MGQQMGNAPVWITPKTLTQKQGGQNKCKKGGKRYEVNRLKHCKKKNSEQK